MRTEGHRRGRDTAGALRVRRDHAGSTEPRSQLRSRGGSIFSSVARTGVDRRSNECCRYKPLRKQRQIDRQQSPCGHVALHEQREGFKWRQQLWRAETCQFASGKIDVQVKESAPDVDQSGAGFDSERGAETGATLGIGTAVKPVETPTVAERFPSESNRAPRDRPATSKRVRAPSDGNMYSWPSPCGRIRSCRVQTACRVFVRT